jgi:mannose-6-phosphate isomerase
MNKPLPTDDPYGESWEMHDSARVVNGDLAGKTLADLLTTYGISLIGDQNDPSEGFPLLAKLLDADDWLSVQVHPNDEQARQLEGDPRGKTEAWIILATEPNSQLVIGVKPGTSREVVALAIRENRLEDLLVYQNVNAGDVLFIAAGTIHAIGPGILLYEIQQSSDMTYRLYDWGRMGLDRNPRPLHIEKSLQVSTVESLPVIVATPDDGRLIMPLVRGQYFSTDLHRFNDPSTKLVLDTHGRFFHILTCIEGEIIVESGETAVTMQKGQTVLIPASLGQYYLSGAGRLLKSMQSE